MKKKSHWEEVYQSKAPDEVSWYQPHSTRSLELINDIAPGHDVAILDVGGGASTLIDDLLAEGYSDLAVMDLSGAALERAQQRLGPAARDVRWLEADVLEAELPEHGIGIWHDRAVFHFFTSGHDQQRYVQQALRALKPGGHLVMASFAEDGPSRCSGLEVRPYSPESLQAVLGPSFALLHSSRELHITPGGREQAFLYCVFRTG